MQWLPCCHDWLLSCGNETEDDTQPYTAFLLLSAIYSKSTTPDWLLCGREVSHPVNPPTPLSCACMEWISPPLRVWCWMCSIKWHESVRRQCEYSQQYCYWLVEAHNSCYYVSNRYNGGIRYLQKNMFWWQLTSSVLFAKLFAVGGAAWIWWLLMRIQIQKEWRVFFFVAISQHHSNRSAAAMTMPIIGFQLALL